MKKHTQTGRISLLLGIFLCLPAIALMAQSQNKSDRNYGNTPSEMLPYGNYENAYIYHFHEEQAFTGAGREKPEPKGLKDVKVGLLAPLENNVLVPQGKQMLQGATLAMEEANARGGYKGIPYKVMPHSDVGLWGAAANEVVKMSDEGCWAVMGTIDDINSHVGIRVALKLEIPWINCGDPDPTFTETNIPWVVRIIADDRQSSYALVNRIHRLDGHKRVAAVRVNNRYGRVGIMEFRDAALRIGYPLVLEVRFEDGDTDFSYALERVKNARPDAVVLWGNALEMGLIINQMREMGMDYPIYASDRAVNPVFIETAGENANGVVTTCQYNPKGSDPKLKAFQTNYKARFGMEPDVFAAHAFDGMNMFIDATKSVGLNKALIRDYLTDIDSWHGVTGDIVFDPSWNDIGKIYMSEIENGDFRFYLATWSKE